MSLTEEEVLEVGCVIKELQTPSPRVRRDMTEAISRHQPELIWNYLSKYKVPKLLRVIRGEKMSPLSLLFALGTGSRRSSLAGDAHILLLHTRGSGSWCH